MVHNPEVMKKAQELDRVVGKERLPDFSDKGQLPYVSLYLFIACVLPVFDIDPALDEEGNPQVSKPEFDDCIVRYPKPFKCTIKPRSGNTKRLVKETCEGS